MQRFDFRKKLVFAKASTTERYARKMITVRIVLKCSVVKESKLKIIYNDRKNNVRRGLS